MKKIKRLNASSLIYALILVFLITIISYSIILLNQYRLESIVKFEKQNRIADNATSAMKLLSTTQFKGRDYIWEGDLFGNRIDSVKMNSNYFGIFQLNLVDSYSHNQHFLSSSFSGPNTIFKNGLILDDSRYVLKIAGDTQLHGGCIVPSKKIEKANIRNHPYMSNKLAFGQITQSAKNFPYVDKTILTRLKYLYEFLENRNTVFLSEFDSINNSHFLETTLLSDSGIVQVKNCYLQNNIIITSKKEVQVFAGSSLDNCVIVAPVVRIESGFKGSVQIIASDSIFIGENVFLEFPSAIVLNASSNKHSILNVGEYSRIQGVILSVNEKMEASSSMTFNPGFLMEGLIYCNGGVSIRDAHINGQLVSRSVNYTTESTNDINTLVDVIINPEMLQNRFQGLNFLGEINRQKIIKWF